MTKEGSIEGQGLDGYLKCVLTTFLLAGWCINPDLDTIGVLLGDVLKVANNHGNEIGGHEGRFIERNLHVVVAIRGSRATGWSGDSLTRDLRLNKATTRLNLYNR